VATTFCLSFGWRLPCSTFPCWFSEVFTDVIICSQNLVIFHFVLFHNHSIFIW